MIPKTIAKKTAEKIMEVKPDNENMSAPNPVNQPTKKERITTIIQSAINEAVKVEKAKFQVILDDVMSLALHRKVTVQLTESEDK